MGLKDKKPMARSVEIRLRKLRERLARKEAAEAKKAALDSVLNRVPPATASNRFERKQKNT